MWDSLDGTEDVVQFEESKGHMIIVSVTLRIKILQHADFYCTVTLLLDHLCGLVVRVSGYRYRGPGFDPRRYQIF